MFYGPGSVEDNDAGGSQRAAELPTANGRVPRVRRTAHNRFTDRRPGTSTRGQRVTADISILPTVSHKSFPS